MLRTHTCGELSISHLNQSVSLAGWVHAIRDKGQIIWIDLRDRYGVTQLVLEAKPHMAEEMTALRSVGREWVLQVQGTVIERSAKNAEMATGEIEVEVTSFKVLNPALLPPFLLSEQTDGGEELRMRYRYLDLRRAPLQRNLLFRHRISQLIRNFLDQHGFCEIETPILVKSTPEGARDFVVPSRLHPGAYYALPQSPQLFKQLLMLGGMDRYYQIARCFRDEALRADRQPEFTQIDCELSFVEADDVRTIFEQLTKHLFQELLGLTLGTFPVLTYAEAMRDYGSDKPDLRWGMAMVGLTTQLPLAECPPMKSATWIGGLVVPENVAHTRSWKDALAQWLIKEHPETVGPFWVRHQTDGALVSSLDKYLSVEQLGSLVSTAGAGPGTQLCLVAGSEKKARKALGQLRLKIAETLPQLATFAPLWVVDFPLLEWDEEEQRYQACHHPFTSPRDEDLHLLNTNPGAVRAKAYDLVINGVEIGGGSIRIHDRTIQLDMFKQLGFTEAEAEKRFGFLLKAFEYGAPPHGGLALGLDRLCLVLNGGYSIREYIAFPKNNAMRDLMLDAPSALTSQQCAELGLLN